MATSVVPALIDALLAEGRTVLTDVAVYDVAGGIDDPGNYLMVGIEDPLSEDSDFSADSKQEWASVGTGAPRDETGEIACCAVAWNGNGNDGTKQARDAVYAIVGAVEDMLRANPSLGVAGVLWTSCATSGQLRQIPGESGAGAVLAFRIYFRARI